MGIKMATIIICIVLILICAFGIFSYVKRLSKGCCGSSDDKVKRLKPQDTDKSHYPYCYQLRIDGMTCKNCAARIENAFNGTGDYYAEVDLNKKIGKIRAKTEAAETEMRRVVARCGYSVISIEQI